MAGKKAAEHPFEFFEFITWHYGKELISRDELAVIDGDKCILQLRGVRPFLSDKHDLPQHPNYKLTGDYNKKNMFDIQKFLDPCLKLKPENFSFPGPRYTSKSTMLRLAAKKNCDFRCVPTGCKLFSSGGNDDGIL